MALLAGIAVSASLLAACDDGSDAGSPEVAEAGDVAVGRATASTRWVPVRAPSDRALLEAPATARAGSAIGEVSVSVPVRIARLHAQPGSVLAAGDPVVDVTAAALLEAAATYRGAAASARAESERAASLEALREEGLARRGDVFEHRARAAALALDRDQAAATLRGASLEPRDAASILRRGVITLTAPVGGVVVAMNANVGELVEPGGAPIARIRGEGPARVEVRTPTAWPTASRATFEGSDGREVPVQPSPLSHAIDPDDGTVLTWYAPVDDAPLPDGLMGLLRVSVQDGVVEVPVRAVRQRTGASQVMRRRAAEVGLVDVHVLGSSGASVFVRGDLRDGDDVAADISRTESDAP